MNRREKIETLFPFQQDGARWLAGKRLALLADDMGLGKSAQAIVAADGIGADRILVLCPASVRINWLREFEKFSLLGGNSFPLLDGASHTRLHAGRIATCSYDLAIRSEVNSTLRNWLSAASRPLLVLDEVHFLKSVDAQRSHAVLGKGGIIHCAARTWALSGTPAPNHLAEMFPLLRCFGAWRNSYDLFVDRFCKTRATPYGPVICGHKNIPEFRRLIAPFILRRKKEEVMKDLPPILFSEVTVAPSEVDYEVEFPEYFLMGREKDFFEDMNQQRAALDGVVSLMGMGKDGLAAVGPFLRTGERKSSSLRRHVGLQKVQGVVDLVKDELNSGLDKIVIFAIHRGVIEGLRAGLVKYGAVALYGGTNPATRQRHIDKFSKEPKCRVFIGNILAAGVGIDGLQKQCCNVLLVEKYGVPGAMAQAIMRVHRNGQTRPVLVRSVRLAGDELFNNIERALMRKTRDLVMAFD